MYLEVLSHREENKGKTPSDLENLPTRGAACSAVHDFYCLSQSEGDDITLKPMG